MKHKIYLTEPSTKNDMVFSVSASLYLIFSVFVSIVCRYMRTKFRNMLCMSRLFGHFDAFVWHVAFRISLSLSLCFSLFVVVIALFPLDWVLRWWKLALHDSFGFGFVLSCPPSQCPGKEPRNFKTTNFF